MKTQKEFQKPLLQFFVVIYLKKESAPTLHLWHWKNYVNYWKKIYVEARRKDKNIYSKCSLIAIRCGLCKFIQFHRPELDIINGSNFKDANLVFKAKIVELKRLGKAKIEHKPPIVSEDLQQHLSYVIN